MIDENENQNIEQSDSGGGEHVDTAESLHEQAQGLQSTPGYIDGSLKNTNPAQYERLQRQITELYQKAESGGQSASSPASAQELELKAKSLQETPGYGDGTLKNHNPVKFARLQSEITELFQQAKATEDQEALQQQAQGQEETEKPLYDRALEEYVALKKLGFDGPFPKDLGEHHFFTWKQQRLLEEGNFDELSPLVMNDLRSLDEARSAAGLYESFMQMKDFDPDLRTKISEAVIAYAFNLKHAKFKESRKA